MEDDSFLEKYVSKQTEEGDFLDYKPQFKGRSEDYYEVTKKDVLLKMIMIIVVLGLCTGIWIGFVYFSLRYPIVYAYLMFIILILYVVIILFTILIGSFKRTHIEKELVQTNLELKVRLKKEKQKIDDENNLLKEKLRNTKDD